MEKFFRELTNTWWGITILCVVCAAVWILLSAALYRQFFKRFYDFVFIADCDCSAVAVIIDFNDCRGRLRCAGIRFSRSCARERKIKIGTRRFFG